ncbi:MAG TPA: GAF domain-containing sensor histidine kinase [Ktedonobacterales bacterium]
MTTHWLPIFQRLTQGASAHLDQRELVREVLERLREAMEVDDAAILLLSENGRYLEVFTASDTSDDMAGRRRIPVGQGVVGAILAGGKPIIVGDLSQLEAQEPLLHPSTGSLLGAPLLLEDRPIGVLHVDSLYPYHFTEEDGEVLQVIAGLVALAIEHTRLRETERAMRTDAEAITRRLRVLQAVSDVALEHARLNELLETLMQRMQVMLAVENVAILLPTPDGQALTLYSVRGPEEAVLGKVHVPMGQGVAGTIAARRQPLIIENLDTVPVANPFLKQHFHSLLGVPLLDGDRLVGVIHVDSTQPRRFTIEDRKLLEALAERIALAIARAQQYESDQERRAAAERRVAVLQEATERMDEFIGIASHELRTPLTSLTMNAQALDLWLNARRRKRPEESEADYAVRAIAVAGPLIQRSLRSIQRLDRLVGDLLNASRIRESRLDLRLQPVDLASLVREIVREHQQMDVTHSVRLKVEAREPVIVEADPERIEQVIINYLNNALKYSRPQQPVTVSLHVGAGQARVSVLDEGVGIPEADLEHIWDRFYQVEATAHQSGSRIGLGLGLYISRDIVERHGGELGVESTPNKGSTFWFSLPLKEPAQAGELEE